MNTNTIEQQIELERHYTTLAQEAFKKRLEQARNQGRITSQPLGNGLKKLFVEALATNIGAWIDENTKPTINTFSMEDNYRWLITIHK